MFHYGDDLFGIFRAEIIVTKTRNAMHSGSVIRLRSAYCQSSFAPQPLQKCESPTVYGRPQFLQ